MTIALTTWKKAIPIERENWFSLLVIVELLTAFSIFGDIINHQHIICFKKVHIFDHRQWLRIICGQLTDTLAIIILKHVKMLCRISIQMNIYNICFIDATLKDQLVNEFL